KTVELAREANIVRTSLAFQLHFLMTPDQSPVTRVDPCGEVASAETSDLCPRSAARYSGVLGSQIRSCPSAPAVAMRCPSGWKAKLTTDARCSRNVNKRWPVPTSQTTAVWSCEPVASRVSSLLIASPITRCSPSKVRLDARVRASHSFAVPSAPAVTRYVPRGEYATTANE